MISVSQRNCYRVWTLVISKHLYITIKPTRIVSEVRHKNDSLDTPLF